MDEYEIQLRKKIQAENKVGNLRDTYSSMMSRQGGNHSTLFPPRIGEKLSKNHRNVVSQNSLMHSRRIMSNPSTAGIVSNPMDNNVDQESRSICTSDMDNTNSYKN